MSHAGKKLFNLTTSCVSDCLEGLVAVNTGLRILAGHQVVIRADIEKVKADGKVTLISGGGSGHEPAHAGYVGPGMLSAAVCGAVFTSPPPSSILSAIRVVGRGSTAGTLLIVKNYTGDLLNFGLAAEWAKSEGLKVEMIVVAEDCALSPNNKISGCRGLCGTVFIHKLAGAMAEKGRPLEEIAAVCKKAAGEMGTIGLSLSPCSLPGSRPSFQLQDDEMELGLGIHGEAGVQRIKMQTAHEAVATMLGHMTDEHSQTRFNLASGDQVALMVNNLGGTSVLELNIVAREAIQQLEKRDIIVERVYCGSLMTSLEMAGVSLTLLRTDNTRRQWLDAPTSAPGWCAPLCAEGESTRVTPGHMLYPEDVDHFHHTDTSGAKVQAEMVPHIKTAISSACQAIIRSEVELNELDTQCGDGDCGATLKGGAEAILQALNSTEGLPVDVPHRLLIAIATVLEKTMGGTSGALYSIFFMAASVPLATDTGVEGWCRALGAGIDAIQKYGRVVPGDRTMLDPLHAAHDAIKHQLTDGAKPVTAMASGAEAAENSALETAKMVARVGRASYVGSETLTRPDPGAHAVAVWMRALYEALRQV